MLRVRLGLWDTRVFKVWREGLVGLRVSLGCSRFVVFLQTFV